MANANTSEDDDPKAQKKTSKQLFEVISKISHNISQILLLVDVPEFQDQVVLLRASLSHAITSIRYYSIYGPLLPKITIQAAVSEVAFAFCQLVSKCKIRMPPHPTPSMAKEPYIETPKLPDFNESSPKAINSPANFAMFLHHDKDQGEQRNGAIPGTTRSPVKLLKISEKVNSANNSSNNVSIDSDSRTPSNNVIFSQVINKVTNGKSIEENNKRNPNGVLSPRLTPINTGQPPAPRNLRGSHHIDNVNHQIPIDQQRIATEKIKTFESSNGIGLRIRSPHINNDRTQSSKKGNSIFDINDENNSISDLLVYLEPQTMRVIQNTQKLLDYIKSENSRQIDLRQLSNSIAILIRRMTHATKNVMSQSRYFKLRENGKWIIDSLDDCIKRITQVCQLNENGSLNEGVTGDFALAGQILKQKLAGIAFDLSKCTKELVKVVEDTGKL